MIVRQGRASRRLRGALAAIAAVALLGGAVPTAYAADPHDLSRTRALRRAVTVDGILAHERQLKKIAEANRLFGAPTRAAAPEAISGRCATWSGR